MGSGIDRGNRAGHAALLPLLLLLKPFLRKIRAAHRDYGAGLDLSAIVRPLADRDYAVAHAEVRERDARGGGEILRSWRDPAKRSAVADGNGDRLTLIGFEGNLPDRKSTR